MIVSMIMWMISDNWIPCTSPIFFLSSSTLAKKAKWARGLMIRGHTIASHTWSHTDMTTLSYEQLHTELARVEQAFIRILGKKPLYVCLLPLLSIFHSPLCDGPFADKQFRPPYGAYSDLVLQVAAERGDIQR